MAPTSTKLRSHIAVISEDISLQNSIRAFISQKGFEVSLYREASSVLCALSAQDKPWDIVLIDENLSSMSNTMLMKRLKDQYPSLPVLVLTESHVVKDDNYDFIGKPVDLPRMQITIEFALHLHSLENVDDSSRELIVGRSLLFLESLEIARRVARSNANVFIYGESGTGKEVLARFIHNESKRKRGPFVAINCSAIPENLLESELFGHSRGAFTGAQEKKIGLFEEAENGTIFLDEIGDLNLFLQAKLLRVLQERKIKPIGENQMRPINARIISATHLNLQQEVAAGRFREDLFFRLNVIPIYVAPLRERPDDILPLALAFLRKFAAENDSPVRQFSKEVVTYLLNNEWQGNVRELRNVVERAVVMANGDKIFLSDFLSGNGGFSSYSPQRETTVSNNSDFIVKYKGQLPSVREVVERYIEFAVSRNGGAKDKTAREIGIDRKTLYKRLRPSPVAH